MDAELTVENHFKLSINGSLVEFDVLRGMMQNPTRPDETEMESKVREKIFDAINNGMKRC